MSNSLSSHQTSIEVGKHGEKGGATEEAQRYIDL